MEENNDIPKTKKKFLEWLKAASNVEPPKKRKKIDYFGEEKFEDELTDRQWNKLKQAELSADWAADQWG